jgi:regulator of protease activity HflC (stomatin/prohibitin superfamily)
VKATFFIGHQQRAYVIERLGSYNRTVYAGLHFKIPIIERIAHKADLRLQQISVAAETKTRDNVFVSIANVVQYLVIEDQVKDAAYKLGNPELQMKPYILDVIRAKVPTMNLDEVFEKKDDVAQEVKANLTQKMKTFGFSIVDSLITDIAPAKNVVEAMNDIQAQTRLRIAATEKGEASKVLAIKAAEAESESKRLQGEGIAKQRKAIADGLAESISTVASASSSSPEEVMKILMLTQYFDTLKELGAGSHSKVVYLPHSPAGLTDLNNAIRNAIMAGGEATNESPK